jgi:hypothetical protein
MVDHRAEPSLDLRGRPAIPPTARREKSEERRLYSQDYQLKRQPARQPALARKIQQSDQQKANAARFRQRMLDAAIKRLLREAVKPE